MGVGSGLVVVVEGEGRRLDQANRRSLLVFMSL